MTPKKKPEDQFKQTYGCKRWRLNNLYHIVDKQGQSTIFKFNDEQAEIWDKCFDASGRLTTNPNTLKSRQLGVTTFFALCYLDDCLWTPNLNVYIQSHDSESITKIFRIVAHAYAKLRPEIKPPLDRGGGSKYEYYFPGHNSRIYVGLQNRSTTIHRLHLSETAFQDTSRIAATMGALPPGVKYSSETTPNGFNWFRDEWYDKAPGRTDIFFPWFMHKAYVLQGVDTGPYTADEKALIDRIAEMCGMELSKAQIEFRRSKIVDLKSLPMFLQEYPEDEASCFMSSGDPAFDTLELNRMLTEAVEPLFEEGPITVFERVSNKGQYVCGADPAEGVGGDGSAAVMMDAKTMSVVATIQGQHTPIEFARLLNKLCQMYQLKSGPMPLLAVEANNHGHAVLLELNEYIHYPNLYKYREGRVGWKTDSVSRPIMIDALEDSIRNDRINFRNKAIIAECLTMVNNKGKIEAAIGKHDDMVIATAIALQMAIDELGKARAFDGIRSKIRI